MSPRPLLAVALSASLLPFAACTTDASDDSGDTGGAAGAYPVAIENCGRTVTIEEAPQRAVSLNQGSTEILLSLGLAERMVGSATWTDPVLPSLAEANESVERLSDDAPSFERVLETEPDFVSASFASTLGEGGVATPEKLAELGVPSYLSPAECVKDNEGDDDGSRDEPLQLDSIYQEVEELSRAFGVEERGDELVADLRERVRTAGESVAAEGVSAMFWFANAESPYLAGCCGAPGIISRTLGLENVFDDTTEEWPQINWETVADRDPDVLVLGDLTRKSQTAESGQSKVAFLESHPVTKEMTAVKEKRYILVTGAEMNPSIRTVDGVENVAAGLRELDVTE